MGVLLHEWSAVASLVRAGGVAELAERWSG